MSDGSVTLLRRRVFAMVVALVIAMSSFVVYSAASASDAEARRCVNIKTCSYP